MSHELASLCMPHFWFSQLIRFARTSSYVTDFKTRNTLLTQEQGYPYHKLRKTF